MESEDRRPVFTKRLVLTILVIILIILIILLLLRKCGKGTKYYSVIGIAAQPTELNLNIGDTEKIYAQVEPSDASNTKYTCVSENIEVAIVDSDCVVTGIGNGTTVIIVTSDDGGKTTTVPVTVGGKLAVLTGIKFAQDTYTVNVGRAVLTNVIAIPEGAKLPQLQYQISDPSIAIVDANGYVKGLKVGTTVLTVIGDNGQYSATTNIVVTKNTNSSSTCKSNEVLEKGKCVPLTGKPTKLILTEPTKTILVGNTYKPGFKIEPSSATQAITCTVPKDKQTILGENQCVLTGLAPGVVTVKVCAKANSKICADLVITVTTSNGGSGSGGGSDSGNTNTYSCSLSYDGKKVIMNVKKPSGVTIKTATINYNGSNYTASTYTPTKSGTAAGQVWFSDGKTVKCPSISVKVEEAAPTYSCKMEKGNEFVSIVSVSASNGATPKVYKIVAPNATSTVKSVKYVNVPGIYRGTVTFTDGAVQSCGSVSVSVIEADRTAPVINCSISSNDSKSGVTAVISASDKASGLKVNPSGTFGNLKSNKTFTATDNAGNNSSVTVNVTSNEVCPSNTKVIYSLDSSGQTCYKYIHDASYKCSSGTLVNSNNTMYCLTTANGSATTAYNECKKHANTCSCTGGTILHNGSCYNNTLSTKACESGEIKYNNSCYRSLDKETIYSGTCSKN